MKFCIRHQAAIVVVAAISLVAAQSSFADPGRALVAHYPLEVDGSDLSGNGNDAVAIGSPGFGTGFRDQAAVFDGIDDLLQAPRSIESDFSISLWLRTSVSAPAGGNWFEGLGLVDAEVCGSPAGGDWGLALINGGHVVWGSTDHISSSSEVNDDQWHSVVITRSISDGRVKLWIDGQLEGSAIAAPLTDLTGPPWIGIGNNPCDAGSGWRFYSGSIDEVRFYDRLLGSLEVLALSDDWVWFDDFEGGGTGGWSFAQP